MTLENTTKNEDERVAAAAALLAGAESADVLESMLAEQMAAVHEAALRVMERAAECRENPQIEALYLRQAARLMHLFVRQAEALDRRRAAAGKRAEEQALEAERVARVEAGERREAEERAHLLGRFMPEPPRRRKRANGANGTGNGARRGAEPPT